MYSYVNVLPSMSEYSIQFCSIPSFASHFDFIIIIVYECAMTNSIQKVDRNIIQGTN